MLVEARREEYRMRFTLIMPLTILGVASHALAQEVNPPQIRSLGVATVYAVPAHVDFWLHLTVTDETLEKSMGAAAQFEENLRGRLTAAELRASDIYVSPPAVSDMQEEKAVRMSARVRFPMASFVSPETGPAFFGRLCDKMASIAEGLACMTEGPIFEPANRESMVQAAVTAATENAYPVADAVAGALRGSIYAVDTVRVREIIWNDAPNVKGVQPNMQQVSCTARVEVIYMLGPHP